MVQCASQQPAASSQQPAASSQQPAASSQQPAASSQLTDRWATVKTTRTVLFACRTLQATTRLFYDVLPLIAHDERIQILFTVDETSEFSGGVPRFLDARQAKTIPWHIATDPTRFRCDLVVSAAVNRNLHQLPKPLLVMAHGAGHHKYRATASGVADSVSGLSRHQLLADGEVIPSAIALGGREQRDRLRSDCPEAAVLAVVTGDICLERLRLSASQRDRYRRHLGVGDEQRLIFLSSTWGPDSLLANHRDLAERLLRRLPADEFRLIAAWHPNCWERHGHPSIAGWLAPSLRSGLMLLPPHEGWRAGLLAADAVVTDHGSVGFYAAALGLPITVASASGTETPADSPAAELVKAAPHLDVAADLATQLRRLTSEPAPDYSAITGQALSEDVSAAESLADLMYELLELDRPAIPPPAAFPLPEPENTIVTAHHVYVHADEHCVDLRAERHPVGETGIDDRHDFNNRVLVVDATETAPRQRLAATAIVWTEAPLFSHEAAAWTQRALAELPGARIAAALLSDGGFLMRSREFGLATARSTPRQLLPTTTAVLHVATREHPPPRILRYRLGDNEITTPIDVLPG